MNKPTLLYISPIASRSGYGEHAREVARFLLQTKDTYEIKFSTVGWGVNPLTGLDDATDTTKQILQHITFEKLKTPPEVFIQMGLPSEFKPIGKYNIGITAGIETTKCSEKFIDGCNAMDLVVVPSNFTKQTLTTTEYIYDQNTIKRCTTPIEVVPQTIDANIFGYDIHSECDGLENQLKIVHEDFCFLFVGQWCPVGNFPGGRKNVVTMIKNFIDTFTDQENPPALILKTHGFNFSQTDKTIIDKSVDEILKYYDKGSTPNIYLLHGELTQEELNYLYNHDKVKCHISYTHGEGFCRPLLEASVSGKPVIASKWSGHLDFLPKNNSVLLPGKLTNLAINTTMFPTGSKWFSVDEEKASELLKKVYSEYERYAKRATKLADANLKKYNSSNVFDIYSQVFNTYIPQHATEVEIKLPTINKTEE